MVFVPMEVPLLESVNGPELRARLAGLTMVVASNATKLIHNSAPMRAL
jgi:hypothetical protein